MTYCAAPSPAVTLIIPAHNEARRLSATVLGYYQVLTERYGPHFELLIVCNGCTDATPDMARALQAGCPQVQVMEIAAAVGKGGAVLAGFREARGDLIAFADADSATSARTLMDLFGPLAECDVVVGSRRHPQSVIAVAQPPLRQALGWTFALAVRSLFRLQVSDTQCGAKAFRRAAARQLAGCVTERFWAFDVELLLRARALGMEIREGPVEWTDQEGSKLRIWPTLIQVVGALWRLRLQSPRPRLAAEWRTSQSDS